MRASLSGEMPDRPPTVLAKVIKPAGLKNIGRGGLLRTGSGDVHIDGLVFQQVRVSPRASKVLFFLREDGICSCGCNYGSR